MNASQNQQLAFTQYLRDPSGPLPGHLPVRPMAIYADLVYNNIEGFLAGFFPVLRSLLADDLWHRLVRLFVQQHSCQTPYFLEISQEFLQFLLARDGQLPEYPPYMLALAHYEWVELALDVSITSLPPQRLEADVLAGYPQLSPLAWPLSYHYPVHTIGPRHANPAPEITHLVVYRNRADEVKFLAANPLSQRLLQLLQNPMTGQAACGQIAAEIAHPKPSQLLLEGKALLEQLLALDIIVGVWAQPAP